MNFIRNGMLGVVGAACAVLLQGCFDKQPAAECQVFTGQYVTGTSNYLALLKKTSGTGVCAEKKAMEVGMSRYTVDGGYAIAVRPADLVDLAIGYPFALQQDVSNDCSWYNADPAYCAECTEATPESDPNEENICMEVKEHVRRVDPRDPTGKGLQAFTGIARVADVNGQCAVQDFTLAQDFEATTATQIDGGVVSFPELKVKHEWTNFKTMMTARAAGNAWTAHLKYTEDGCTAEYDVTGLWPMVECSTDADCDPDADVAAGRSYGSGLSPDFKPRCDTSLTFRVTENGFSGNYDLATTTTGNYSDYAVGNHFGLDPVPNFEYPNTVHHGLCVLGEGVDVTALK